MAISYLSAGKGNVTGKGVSTSSRSIKSNLPESDVQKEEALDLRKQEDVKKFIAAQKKAREIKEARVAELKARGGRPVSALERTSLAQQQASKYGVGVAPQLRSEGITVVDASGKKTKIDNLAAYKAQAEAFSKGRVTDVRQYGEVLQGPKPVRTEVILASKKKDLNRERDNLLQKNDTRTISKYVGFADNSSNSSSVGMVDQEKKPKESFAKRTAIEYGKGLYSIIKESTIGMGQLLYGPNIKAAAERKAKIKSSEKKEDKTVFSAVVSRLSKSKGEKVEKFYEEKLFTEGKHTPQTKTAILTIGIGAAGYAAPAIIGTGIAGFSGFSATKSVPKALREKTPESTAAAALDITNIGLGVFDAAPAIAGRLSFLGKTKIAAERITAPEVLAGETRFPVMKNYRAGKGAELLLEFKTGKYKLTPETGGFHASPEKLNLKTGIGPGSSETAGLYISPELSPHFLKITGEGKTTISLLPKRTKPTIQYIETPVERIPSSVRSKGFSAMQEFMGTPKSIKAEIKPAAAGSGKARISPQFEAGFKAEKEAIIPIESKLLSQPKKGLWNKITGFEEYTIIEGKKVPIKKFKTKTFEKDLTVAEAKAIKKTRTSFEKEIRLTESYRRGERNISLAELIPKVNIPKRTYPTSSKTSRPTKAFSSKISIPKISRQTSKPSISRPKKAISKKSISKKFSSDTDRLISKPFISRGRSKPTISRLVNLKQSRSTTSILRKDLPTPPVIPKKKKNARPISFLKKKRPIKTKQFKIYTPDYTSRATENIIKVNKAQARKLLRTRFTGLEIRPEVILT